MDDVVATHDEDNDETFKLVVKGCDEPSLHFLINSSKCFSK
jgi:hypothetical protein